MANKTIISGEELEHYSGDLYIFDFDDTLMWGPDWHATIKTNEHGIVINPGDSPTIKDALNLLLKLDELPVPKQMKKLGLKLDIAYHLDYRTYFMVVDENHNGIKLSHLRDYVSEDEIINAGIIGPSKCTEYAAVCNDLAYYRNIDTIGNHGPNKEIMDLYRSVSTQSIILTARCDVPGMRERILEKISAHAPAPLDIYMQYLGSPCSGTYKGNVIKKIAEQKQISHIYFFDDNPKYVEKVEKVINGTGLENKITIRIVDTSDKPILAYNQIQEMVKVANKWDKERMFEQADTLDQRIRDMIYVD